MVVSLLFFTPQLVRRHGVWPIADGGSPALRLILGKLVIWGVVPGWVGDAIYLSSLSIYAYEIYVECIDGGEIYIYACLLPRASNCVTHFLLLLDLKEYHCHFLRTLNILTLCSGHLGK